MNPIISRLLFVCFFVGIAFIGRGQNIILSFTNPTDKEARNGSIKAQGLAQSTNYDVTYTVVTDTTTETDTVHSVKTDNNGALSIPNLGDGKYSKFIFARTD